MYGHTRSPYATPEDHAANPPSTWRVEKVTNYYRKRPDWTILDRQDRALGSFDTRKVATEALVHGVAAQQWEQDRTWFAGEPTPGRRPYAEVQREKAEQERKERRKIERAGVSVEQVANWRKALADLDRERREHSASDADGARDDERTDRLDAACEALEQMLEALTDGTRFDPESLDQTEAAEQYRELSAQFGFESSVSERLNRMEYLGLDAGKSALDVLREMHDEEREATAPQLWAVAA